MLSSVKKRDPLALRVGQRIQIVDLYLSGD